MALQMEMTAFLAMVDMPPRGDVFIKEIIGVLNDAKVTGPFGA